MSEPQPNRLDGWKSIADHLGRDPRTAQRWHRERGMPVHHVPGSSGGTVFAFADELNGWLSAGASAKSSSPLVAHTPSPAVLPAHADDSEQLRTPHARRAVVAVAAVLLLTGVFGVTRFRTGAAPPRVASIDWNVNGTVLSAIDADRKTVWSFQFPLERAAAAAGVQVALERAAAIDLNGDGDLDVAATVNYIDSRSRIAQNPHVYHLGTEGNLLWRYQPHRSLTFAGLEFMGPWRAYGAIARGHHHLWVSFVHRTWWPSFVVGLNSDGAERLALVNAGHIEALQTVEVGGRELVLAGGFNNEFMLPALAAFEAQGATVVSPQTPGTPFVCDNCPPERPLVYMVFPRSDVNIALGSAFISVADIEKPDSTGVVEVSVRDLPHATREIYRLSPDFVPQSVAFSDAHWAVHRELSGAGKLDHAAENCAARHEGVIVRVWQLATGWRDVRVSPTFAISKS